MYINTVYVYIMQHYFSEIQFRFTVSEFCTNVLIVLALTLHFSFDAHRKSSG